MINNNNENINKVRTDKWFSAFLVTCSASSIGAVTVTSGSASQAQNMTSANAAAVNKQMNIGQDTANALTVSSNIPGFDPLNPFTNGDNK